MPPTAPKVATRTDSQRTMDRIWRPGRAHRPQQPQLPGPLVDGQGQGVGDAHEGDEDGQGQHHVDQGQHPVDAGRGRVDVLLTVLDLGLAEVVGDGLDRHLTVGDRHAVGQGHQDDGVDDLDGVLGPQVGRHHPLADQLGVLVGGPDGQVDLLAVLEGGRDGVADGPALVSRRTRPRERPPRRSTSARCRPPSPRSSTPSRPSRSATVTPLVAVADADLAAGPCPRPGRPRGARRRRWPAPG